MLHAQGEYAYGRWVALSYDGYAALARTQEQVQHAVARVKEGRVALMTYDLCEVTVTAPDREWLEDLCRQLIDAGLASSAHVLHPVTSIYRWQGEVHEAIEARAFLRTRASLVDIISRFVVERHAYEVPNVTALPIVAGNQDYLAWVRAETSPPPRD